jgi:peptidoglycan glycosyltransferase
VNSPIRKVAAGCLLLSLALLANITYVQAFQADELNDREGNRRVLIDEYARERGPILVGDEAIASSVPTDGEFAFLREYHEPELYAQTTGFYSFIFGRSYIESAQNDILAGTDDSMFVRRLIDLVTGQEPRGGSVKLTLNPEAQRAAYDALGDNKGAAVAIEPATGKILAMVSKPSYDPSGLASHSISEQQEAWDALAADEDNPALNRGIDEWYPPGSVFKTVTAAAALENGYEPDSVLPGPAVMDLPQTTVTLSNYNDQPCGPDDETTITNALRISCNTAFAQLGLDLGDDVLREQAERFGFNSTHLTNDGMDSQASQFLADLDPPQTAQSAIGQRDVRATPLQMAMVTAAVANDGVLMNPYLVDEIRGPDVVTLINRAEPEELSRAVSPSTAQQLVDMMVEVVENGTGVAAQMPDVAVGGKTGTAQTAPDRPPNAWFTAFAPADNPEVAVAVVIEEAPGVGRDEISGGRLAAPIAVAVMEAVLGS